MQGFIFIGEGREREHWPVVLSQMHLNAFIFSSNVFNKTRDVVHVLYIIKLQ